MNLLATRQGFCYGLGASPVGSSVTCHMGKTQHVPERERTPLLAAAGMKDCGYVPCTMSLVTHKCEHGIPVSVTDTCLA